jgi:hypothetical protein
MRSNLRQKLNTVSLEATILKENRQLKALIESKLNIIRINL